MTNGRHFSRAALAAIATMVPLLVGAQATVEAPDKPKPAGLLLPAVQKVQAQEAAAAREQAAGREVQQAPQRGIEPDEIDARSRATGAPPPRAVDRAAPRPPARPATAGTKLSVQQMMVKLKPRHPVRMPATAGAGSGPTSVQAKPQEPPKYEIAECGTEASPMICCHHEAGDGSSCNLFKILCQNAGGTATGDGESAACSDW